jgi:hypothetical protein
MHVHQLGSSTMDQQCAQVDIAAFGDPAESGSTTGGVLSGGEPEPGGELSTVLEVAAIADGGDDGAGGDGSDTRDLS